MNDSSPVTDYLALAVNTVAGKVDMSRQLFDRSNPSADTIIAQDLSADYAKQLDTQLLTQATNGVLNLSGTNAITCTDATATVPDGSFLIWRSADAARVASCRIPSIRARRRALVPLLIGVGPAGSTT